MITTRRRGSFVRRLQEPWFVLNKSTYDVILDVALNDVMTSFPSDSFTSSNCGELLKLLNSGDGEEEEEQERKLLTSAEVVGSGFYRETAGRDVVNERASSADKGFKPSAPGPAERKFNPSVIRKCSTLIARGAHEPSKPPMTSLAHVGRSRDTGCSRSGVRVGGVMTSQCHVKTSAVGSFLAADSSAVMSDEKAEDSFESAPVGSAAITDFRRNRSTNSTLPQIKEEPHISSSSSCSTSSLSACPYSISLSSPSSSTSSSSSSSYSSTSALSFVNALSTPVPASSNDGTQTEPEVCGAQKTSNLCSHVDCNIETKDISNNCVDYIDNAGIGSQSFSIVKPVRETDTVVNFTASGNCVKMSQCDGVVDVNSATTENITIALISSESGECNQEILVPKSQESRSVSASSSVSVSVSGSGFCSVRNTETANFRVNSCSPAEPVSELSALSKVRLSDPSPFVEECMDTGGGGESNAATAGGSGSRRGSTSLPLDLTFSRVSHSSTTTTPLSSSEGEDIKDVSCSGSSDAGRTERQSQISPTSSGLVVVEVGSSKVSWTRVEKDTLLKVVERLSISCLADDTPADHTPSPPKPLPSPSRSFPYFSSLNPSTAQPSMSTLRLQNAQANPAPEVGCLKRTASRDRGVMTSYERTGENIDESSRESGDQRKKCRLDKLLPVFGHKNRGNDDLQFKTPTYWGTTDRSCSSSLSLLLTRKSSRHLEPRSRHLVTALEGGRHDRSRGRHPIPLVRTSAGPRQQYSTVHAQQRHVVFCVEGEGGGSKASRQFWAAVDKALVSGMVDQILAATSYGSRSATGGGGGEEGGGEGGEVVYSTYSSPRRVGTPGEESASDVDGCLVGAFYFRSTSGKPVASEKPSRFNKWEDEEEEALKKIKREKERQDGEDYRLPPVPSAGVGGTTPAGGETSSDEGLATFKWKTNILRRVRIDQIMTSS